MREVLRQKIADALAGPPPPLTRRDARLPAVSGKAFFLRTKTHLNRIESMASENK